MAAPYHNENDPIVDPTDPTDPINHSLDHPLPASPPPPAESLMDKMANMAAAAKESAAQALESVNDTAHRWFDKGKDDVATAYDTTADKASEAAEIAKQKAEDAWDTSKRTAEDVYDTTKSKASGLFDSGSSSSSSSASIDSKSYSSSSSSSSSEPYPSSMISDADRAALHRENAELHTRAAAIHADIAKEKGTEAVSDLVGNARKSMAESSFEDAKHTPAGAYENTAVRDKVEQAKDAAADTWQRTKRDINDAAETAKDYVSDKAQAAKETVESGWEKTKEVASDMTDATKDKAHDASVAASRSFDRAKDSAADTMAEMDRRVDRMGARISDKDANASLQRAHAWEEEESKAHQLAGAATKDDARHLGLVDRSGAQTYRPPLVEPISPRDVDKTTDTYLLSKSHPAAADFDKSFPLSDAPRSEHAPGFMDAARESLAHIGSSLSQAGQALKETVVGSKPADSDS